MAPLPYRILVYPDTQNAQNIRPYGMLSILLSTLGYRAIRLGTSEVPVPPFWGVEASNPRPGLLRDQP